MSETIAQTIDVGASIETSTLVDGPSAYLTMLLLNGCLVDKIGRRAGETTMTNATSRYGNTAWVSRKTNNNIIFDGVSLNGSVRHGHTVRSSKNV